MASLQQVVEQLVLLAAQGTNSTTGPDATSTTSATQGPLGLMTSIFKMLFSASALRDWAILLVIGSSFETARRLLASLWQASINACFITAVFEDDDISFRWIMHWLSKQPSWKGARNVLISTSNFALDDNLSEDLDPRSQKVNYLPAESESYTLWHKYRRMRITRNVVTTHGGWSSKETLTMSILTRDHAILAEILQNAKNAYIDAQKDKITVYISESRSDGWRVLATRPKRPLNSIILDSGITQLVVEDVQDFLNSKEWYAERGIPFRRGYLLHGAPGSGKTSLIHSIAGELRLNVYIITLSRPGLDDAGLFELISLLPERCIALMEDIDAAFHHSLSREPPNDTSTQPSQTPNGPEEQPSSSNRVSLSGLLNALDGIGAQEGRILFATTNKYSSLDPALCRPGRMDLHIEFKLASRFQAEELFKRFYAPMPSASVSAKENKHVGTSEKHENGCIGVDMSEDPLIDLSESQSQSQPHPVLSSSPQSSPLLPSSSLPSPSPSQSVIEKNEEDESLSNDSPQRRPTYIGVVHSRRAPKLSRDRIDALAAQFALAIPERQLSMATLQGFLMMHKTRPFTAVAEIGAWVGKELSERRGEKDA